MLSTQLCGFSHQVLIIADSERLYGHSEMGMYPGVSVLEAIVRAIQQCQLDLVCSVCSGDFGLTIAWKEFATVKISEAPLGYKRQSASFIYIVDHAYLTDDIPKTDSQVKFRSRGVRTFALYLPKRTNVMSPSIGRTRKWNSCCFLLKHETVDCQGNP